MASEDLNSETVVKPSQTPYQLDLRQTTQACKVLLRHIAEENTRRKSESAKPNLLAADNDSGDDEPSDETPIWMILTTKTHIVDQKRLKPSKISLPHPIPFPPTSTICLITADRSSTYTDLIASPLFPAPLRQRISRVVTLDKLKTTYGQYEARRKLFAEHDIFLADDRIVTYLPKALGKVFYKSGSKRPVPVLISGGQKRDESGKRVKRDPAEELKAKENRTSTARGVGAPEAVAKEIERALRSALVHLAPGVSTAVKVGQAGMKEEEVATNVEAVMEGLTKKVISKGWRNVRAIHVKGPNTMAFPIWLASELWVEEGDVHEEKPEAVAGQKKKKEKRSSKGKLTNGDAPTVKAIEASKDASATAAQSPSSRKRKADGSAPSVKSQDVTEAKHASKKRKADAKEKLANDTIARKERVKKQKEDALAEVR